MCEMSNFKQTVLGAIIALGLVCLGVTTIGLISFGIMILADFMKSFV